MTRRIEEVNLPIDSLRLDFGNPKSITKKELEKLKQSIVENGDFGVIVINEENQVLSGNQRVVAMRELGNIETVACKRLIGYSLAEQKRVLLEANATRGKYNFEQLEEFLEGTDLQMSDFNISTAMIDQDKIDIDKDTFDQEPEEDPVVPLVVAVDEREYAQFIELKSLLGLKDNSAVINRVIKLLKK